MPNFVFSMSSDFVVFPALWSGAEATHTCGPSESGPARHTHSPADTSHDPGQIQICFSMADRRNVKIVHRELQNCAFRQKIQKIIIYLTISYE